MSIAIVTSAADASDEERWRLWRLGYAESSRKADSQMRIVFAVVVITLAVVVALQLLNT